MTKKSDFMVTTVSYTPEEFAEVFTIIARAEGHITEFESYDFVDLEMREDRDGNPLISITLKGNEYARIQ